MGSVFVPNLRFGEDGNTGSVPSHVGSFVVRNLRFGTKTDPFLGHQKDDQKATPTLVEKH